MMTGFGGLGGFGNMFGLGGLAMFGMFLIPIVLIGLVVWAVVEATRRRDERGPVAHPAGYAPPYTSAPPHTGAGAGPVGAQSTFSSALAILEERYARGEIDRDDYLARRQDLRQ